MATTQNTTTARCLSCHRPLRSAKSIAAGRGPRCQAKVAAAANVVDLTDYKPAQADKARELIEQGAILPTRRPGIYLTVASDGTTTYLTHSAQCTCKAGRWQRRCYHTAAARILTAATPARRAA